MSSIPDEVASHSFLEGMTPAQAERVMALATREVFEAGDHMMHVGDPEPGAYLILSGLVALQVNSPARGPVLVETLLPNETVGWSWLVYPHRSTFDVVALETTVAYHLDSRGTRALCEEDHDLGFLVARRLLGVVSQRLAATRFRLLDLYADVY